MVSMLFSRASSYPGVFEEPSPQTTRKGVIIPMDAALISVVVSFFSLAIAFAAFMRTVLDRVPSVHLVCLEGDGGETEYRVDIHNPSRRVVLLEEVEVVEPSAQEVAIHPVNASIHGTVARAYYEHTRHGPNSPRFSVFVAIPPNEFRFVTITFTTPPSNDDAIHLFLNLWWSNMTPWLVRVCYPRFVKRSNDQLCALWRAADTLR